MKPISGLSYGVAIRPATVSIAAGAQAQLDESAIFVPSSSPGFRMQPNQFVSELNQSKH